MQQTNITMWKLNQYWKATEASKKWQLLIFDAGIQSKLLYGMETLQLTETLSNNIDAFQMKSFRNKSREKTHWDGFATNERALQEASRALQEASKVIS